MLFMWELKLHKLCEFFHLFSKPRNSLSFQQEREREREKPNVLHICQFHFSFPFSTLLTPPPLFSFLILAYFAYYYTFKRVISDYKYHLGLIIEQEKRKPINHKVLV